MILDQPQLLALLLLLPIFLVIWLWRGRRLSPLALLLRLVTIALLVLAATNPTFEQTALSPASVIILVDQSDSLTAPGQAALRTQAHQIAREITASGDTGTTEDGQPVAATVLWFGNNVVVPGGWSDTSLAPDPPPTLAQTLDPSASDIGGALRTARELLVPATIQPDAAPEEAASDTSPGQIVLLSDGFETSHEALAEARRAADAGIVVHVLSQEAAQDPLSMSTMQIDPLLLREGEPFQVRVTVQNDAGMTSEATLRLHENGQVVQEQQVTLEPGQNSFELDSTASAPGVKRLEAEIVGTPDTFVENNTAAATLLVAPRPYVLLVEGRNGNSMELSDALYSVGIDSEIIASQQLPSRPSELQRYDGMVLIDVPAYELNYDQMANIESFVSKDGRGLVITGGPNSYGLGGYEETPLEQVAPVLMEPAPHDQRPDVALLLILDRSASMTVARGVSKLDMAKEAAILSTETLKEEDSLGVLAFDTRQQWTVPLQRIGDGLELSQIRDTIARLASGGGTDIYGALQSGLSDLLRYPASVRHVVLLSDGRSFTNDMSAYQRLIESARAQQITISTIAIGFDSDTELLNQLADWGNGRYYFAEEAKDIPQLTLRESEIASSDPTIEGEFTPQATEPHPILRELTLDSIPFLNGYVATTEKETADVVLRSPNNDPVLISWQYGLGRAVAWTPSIADPWAEEWLEWGDYATFWGQVVNYTLPDPRGVVSPISVQFTPRSDGTTRMVVDAVETSGVPFDRADVYARITMPNGTERDIGFRQIGPGRYVQDLELPSAGAYGVLVQVNSEDGKQYHKDIGYVHTVSTEYAPVVQREQGRQLLAEIARMTGGNEITSEWSADGSTTPIEDESQPARTLSLLERIQASFSDTLWLWLLGGALCTWVLEIAVRRGVFDRR